VGLFRQGLFEPFAIFDQDSALVIAEVGPESTDEKAPRHERYASASAHFFGIAQMKQGALDVLAGRQLKPMLHRERILGLLRMYARAGRRLDEVAAPHIMNRSIATLKRYCCQNGIAFVDYVPRHMRAKKRRRKRDNRGAPKTGA